MTECDACNRAIMPNEHQLVLRDFYTARVIGCYHAHPSCQVASTAKHFEPGVAIRATVFHPKRCGGGLENCDGGWSEGITLSDRSDAASVTKTKGAK